MSNQFEALKVEQAESVTGGLFTIPGIIRCDFWGPYGG